MSLGRLVIALSEPKQVACLAAKRDLSDDRAESCIDEYESLSRS
jgi:hypothetical protein